MPPMLATIIVPLDGSDFAARALPHAAVLGRSSGAKLVLVRVLAHRAPGSAVDELEAIQAALNLDAEALRADGLRVETIVRRVHHVHADGVARAIAEVADDQQAELIVMSTHGRGGLGRWVYGSVADSVLQQSTTPVLLVSPHVDSPLPTDRRLRVLVPLDGSDLGEEAIETADLLAGTFDTELTVLQVVEPLSYPLHYLPYDLDAELGAARQYLQTQVDRLQARNRRVTARATTGNPSWVVAQVSREVEADVVVMATHGRTGLDRLVLGSVATATLQRADVPVLLVRPAAMLASDSARGVAPASEANAATASPLTSVSVPTVNVRLSMADLELIERGLKTLAYTPGYDYHQSPRIRALVDRLDSAVRPLEADEHAGMPEPATTR
jgi:nucleotide-binding universal stress UspA family protein